MKKSLSEAIEGAKRDSVTHADTIITVLDKKGKAAVTSTSEWVCRERILAGYHTVARYLNGKEYRNQ